VEADVNVKDLVRIKISQLIKFAESFSGIEVHIPVGAKFVRMNYATETFVEILRRLQQKEVEDVYVKAEDCTRILTQLQESLSAKQFYDPGTLQEKKMETVEASMQVVREVIGQMGVDKQTVEILKSINLRSMSLISESPSLFAFVKKFKKNCSDEFIQMVLISYLTSLVIDKFPWTSNPVKEKASLAAMLCDVTLNREDFQNLKDHELNGTELSDKVKKHPTEVADLLRQRKELIPSETITIIEQHHELPSGKGFPHGITSSRFNQLSSTFIICHAFIEALFENKFDYTTRHEIIKKMRDTYACKNFDKAIDALVEVVA
jgi:response regulator RpfG family c-di-GMP phosphodiesterase